MHLNLNSWPQQSMGFPQYFEILGDILKIGDIPASRSLLELAERMLKFQSAAQLFSHCYSKSIACRSEATSTRLRLSSSSRKPISNNDCPYFCRLGTHRLGLAVGSHNDNIDQDRDHSNLDPRVNLELMLQLYYQFCLVRVTYLEPAITSIPKSGLIGDSGGVAAALRLITVC